jgi:multidrug efflux pump subunit AcrB
MFRNVCVNSGSMKFVQNINVGPHAFQADEPSAYGGNNAGPDSHELLLAALAGIAWFLFITHTTLSVPALMGAIMCMGVATSNSILVVSFATEKMTEGMDSVAAALEAGFTRFRPVLMTALAMIIGMVPMALGLGDGGEQNAPLGRAVIGGLIFATVSTLFFVPAFFSVLQGSLRHSAQAEKGH